MLFFLTFPGAISEIERFRTKVPNLLWNSWKLYSQWIKFLFLNIYYSKPKLLHHLISYQLLTFTSKYFYRKIMENLTIMKCAVLQVVPSMPSQSQLLGTSHSIDTNSTYLHFRWFLFSLTLISTYLLTQKGLINYNPIA